MPAISATLPLSIESTAAICSHDLPSAIHPRMSLRLRRRKAVHGVTVSAFFVTERLRWDGGSSDRSRAIDRFGVSLAPQRQTLTRFVREHFMGCRYSAFATRLVVDDVLGTLLARRTCQRADLESGLE
jgi:hypothetical protein